MKKVKTLLPLTEFVSLVESEIEQYPTNLNDAKTYLESVIDYNRFLKMPLSLDMFTSGKYFKDIQVQDSEDFVKFYGGIRVYNHYPDTHIDKWFSEVFVNGIPRRYKTVGDLVHYELHLAPQ
jgi:hypothetical protein